MTDVGHGEASFELTRGEIVRVGRQQVVVEIRPDGVPVYLAICVLLSKGWLRICYLRAAGTVGRGKLFLFIIALFL